MRNTNSAMFNKGGTFTADELINAIIDAFDSGVPKDARIIIKQSENIVIKYDQEENILRIEEQK